MYRNAKNVGYYMIGSGSLTQLGDLLGARRAAVNGPAVFFVDKFFEGKDLLAKLPVENKDMVLYVDTTDEPTTDSVDGYTDQVKAFLGGATPCALLAFGGGCVLDTCKCVGNLLTNPGKDRTAKPWQGRGPLLRLHIGLENPEDLIADLEAGFERMRRELGAVCAK